MKKVLLVLMPLLPVFYVLTILGLFLLDVNDEQLFVALGGYIVIPLAATILHCWLTSNSASYPLTLSNMWAYISNLALFLFEAVYWVKTLIEVRIAEQNGAMGGGLGLVLLILLYLPHWVSYSLTHVAGAIGCSRVLQDKCTPGVRICHILLQLFPFTDLISEIWVLNRVKKQEN
jgi:hypothetical protein